MNVLVFLLRVLFVDFRNRYNLKTKHYIIYTEKMNAAGKSFSAVEDDLKLRSLLQQFELEEIYTDLKNAKITFRNLKYLKKEDIHEVIKPIGLRAEFREKLFAYLKSDNAVHDETLNNNLKVQRWLDKECLIESPFSPKLISTNESLLGLLQSSSKGKYLLSYYLENSCFTKNQRDDLIQIIVDEILAKGTKLRPHNFSSIVEEIVTIFANEKQNQDYYYISRQKRKNPSGKLYSKYFNLKSKRRKLDTSNLSPSDAGEEELEATEPEVNEPVEIDKLLSLKTILKSDSSDWDDALDKWERTFSLRQSDFEKYSKLDFLLEWPKFNDARAPSLINIDFKLIYPEKEHQLKSKWEIFKNKIVKYYDSNIRNPKSKNLLVLAKESKKNNCEDYILTILLNSVLLPSARFKSADGTYKKKATIQDASDSLVLHLTHISEFQIKINELVDKYYENKLTIQPYILVEGSTIKSLKSFYVYFDKTLYKFDTFIESLDICFKIFQVFNLKYPQICEIPWIFIQHYFYEIFHEFDAKSSDLSSLLNFMCVEN